MIEKPRSRSHLAAAFRLLLPLFLMYGCTTVTPPERQLPIAAAPEIQLQPKTVDSPQVLTPEESPVDAKQRETAEIDEEHSIFFALGSSSIPQNEKAKLQRLATLLKADKSLFVTLAGHANDNGSRSFNLAVADARVESVGSYLKRHGVGARQIMKLVIGGEKTPRSCRSTECRQRMRRVEITLAPAEKERLNGIQK